MTAYKDKEGKLRFDLIPPEMNLAFAEVATFGIEKLKKKGIENPERNWEKGLKLVEDHGAAHDRHYNKWLRGIDLDEESGLNHLKHALWHLTAMVTQLERARSDLDDRPSVSIELLDEVLNVPECWDETVDDGNYNFVGYTQFKNIFMKGD